LSKKFVLNADDFGMNAAFNTAVKEGYECGILKSASLVANGEAFEEAVKKIIPQCEGLGVGVHLNIIEGKSLLSDLTELTDSNGNFNNSYIKLLIKSYGSKKNIFLKQIEDEFRAQIEKIRNTGIKITHIDSHVHTHSIPEIFKIVCKLANEYNITQIRTQFEKPYIVPEITIHLNKAYFINIIKIILLDSFTIINKPVAKKYHLSTNDYLLGVGYTSMMTSLTVAYGLEALKDKNDITAEALIHPCRYEDGTIDNHFDEYKITRNEKLKNKIEELGFEIVNYNK